MVGVEVARSSQVYSSSLILKPPHLPDAPFKLSRSDMQPNLYHPGRAQTPRRQENHRIRTRRFWDPTEQETSGGHCSEEG